MREKPDHHDAELLLRLYELRREEKLRQARDWVIREFQADSVDEMAEKYPHGSPEDTFLRMTVSYWDMAASIVNQGLVQEIFFFETNSEFWVVWEKIKHLVPSHRAIWKNPELYKNLEILASKYEKWLRARAPDALPAMQDRLRTRSGSG